ncbi:MAG: hypothetical protein R2698_02630 [Microthrixaceae bacterium]
MTRRIGPLALLLAAALPVAACSTGHTKPAPAMSERLAKPNGHDLAEFEQFFPRQPGAIPMVERQMLWGWDKGGPYGWRNKDGSSTHTVVRDGRRVGLEVPHAAVTVWLFGGSTAFGVGQSQDRTIASDLVRLTHDRGIDIRIENFGVSGYVNWQETSQFVDLLNAGQVPDIAVFLDGANETALAVEREQYGLLDPTRTYFLSMSDDQRKLLEEQRVASGYESTGDLDRAAGVQAVQYRRGIDLMRQAAAAHGVATIAFWQPDLYTISPTAPGVKAALKIWNMDLDRQAALARLSASIRERSGVAPVDLSSSLDGAKEPIFFDVSHSNEYGARLQAEAMLPHLMTLLKPDR